MLIALVAVVAAVALAVLGDGGVLKDADPERVQDRLPPDRPLVRADVEAVRLPTGARGYRMADVDEVLDRLGAELAERDARIAELEASLAGARGGATLYTGEDNGPVQLEPRPADPYAPGWHSGPGQQPYGGRGLAGEQGGQGYGSRAHGPEQVREYGQEHGQEHGQEYGGYGQEPYGRPAGEGPDQDGEPGGRGE